jgi:hypothetical protein
MFPVAYAHTDILIMNAHARMAMKANSLGSVSGSGISSCIISLFWFGLGWLGLLDRLQPAAKWVLLVSHWLRWPQLFISYSNAGVIAPEFGKSEYRDLRVIVPEPSRP